MFNTLPSIIELPKLNNIFLEKNCIKKNKKKNKQNNDGILTPPIRHIKNNILLKITFGEKPFSIIFDKKIKIK